MLAAGIEAIEAFLEGLDGWRGARPRAPEAGARASFTVRWGGMRARPARGPIHDIVITLMVPRTAEVPTVADYAKMATAAEAIADWLVLAEPGGLKVHWPGDVRIVAQEYDAGIAGEMVIEVSEEY